MATKRPKTRPTTTTPSDQEIRERIAAARAAGRSVMLAYYRLSDLKQDQIIGGGSTGEQSSRMHYLGDTTLDADVCIEFADDDISAGYDREREDRPKDRPGFQEALLAIRKYKPDYVGSVYGSRLQRNLREYVDLTDACSRVGAIIVSEIEANLDPRNDEQYLMGAIRSVTDGIYVSKISKGRRSKQAERRRDGVPSPGGSRWYGFEDDKLTPRRSEADLLLSIARELLGSEDVSLRAICRRLDEQHVPTPSKACASTRKTRERATQQWSPQTLKKLLRRPANCGWIAHEGELVREYAAVEDGEITPIMSRELWDRLQRVLDRRADLGGGNAPGVDPQAVAGKNGLLSGMLVCGAAGCKMRMFASSRRNAAGQMTRVYRCDRSHTSIVAEPVEDLVRDFVIEYGSDPTHQHEVAAAADERSERWHELNAELHELRGELRLVQRGKDESGKRIPLSLATARTEEIEGDIEEARAKMKQIDPHDPSKSIREQTRARLTRRWDAEGTSTSDRRDMIRACASGFQVAPVGRGKWQTPVEERITVLPL